MELGGTGAVSWVALKLDGNEIRIVNQRLHIIVLSLPVYTLSRLPASGVRICTPMENTAHTWSCRDRRYEDHGDNAHCYLDMQICKLYFLHVQMPGAFPRALTAYSCTIQHHIGKSLGVSRICTQCHQRPLVPPRSCPCASASLHRLLTAARRVCLTNCSTPS